MNSKLNRSKLWSKLRDPDYRNAFVSSTVAARLAVRIYNLRKKANWNQPQLAEKAGMKQARVSLLEQGDYENFTFSTLKKLAAAFNVAVLIDFVSFPDFVTWSGRINSESVAPESFAESDRALIERMCKTATAGNEPSTNLRAPRTHNPNSSSMSGMMEEVTEGSQRKEAATQLGDGVLRLMDQGQPGSLPVQALSQ